MKSKLVKAKRRIIKSVLKKYFLSFLHKSFLELNPNKNFLHNWHLELIADYLQAIERKQITRLIINVPPRTLKSTCISVAWPAWLLGHDPSAKIIVASYAMQLAIKHSIDTKTIITSNWYKEIFPKTQLNKSFNTKKKFLTTEQGFRIGTSVGASITGEGANVLIVDDPHNPTYMHSNKMRSKAIYWYENTFATRLNDPANDVIIIIMHRLHPDDLCNHLLKNNNKINWHQVTIPAVSDKQIIYKSLYNEYQFKKNSSIQESRLPINYLQKLRCEIGENVFFAQYQQQPTKRTFGILKRHHLAYYDVTPDSFKFIAQSWDTAFKTQEHNDFSVCTTWGASHNGTFYLLDLFVKKINYIELKAKILALRREHQANIIIIEDHSSGQAIIQELKNQLPNLVSIKHKINKFARFSSILPMIYEKKVLFPKNNLLSLPTLIDELTSFPYSKHDDIVDSISQFCMHVMQKQQKDLFIREL